MINELSSTLDEILADLAELRKVPRDAVEKHSPVQVMFEEHGTPADVCWGCSEPDDGRWVPVTQCPRSLAVFDVSGPVAFPRWGRALDD